MSDVGKTTIMMFIEDEVDMEEILMNSHQPMDNFEVQNEEFMADFDLPIEFESLLMSQPLSQPQPEPQPVGDGVGKDHSFLVPQKSMNQTPNIDHGHAVSSEVADDMVMDNNEKEVIYNNDEEANPPQQTKSPFTLTKDRKPRLQWTPELHTCFVNAVNQLGGSKKATPKTVQRIMNVKGLTLFQVKSHLQKFRQGKRVVKHWVEAPKNNALGASNSQEPEGQGNSLSLPPVRANDRRKGKTKAKKEAQGSRHMEREVEKALQRRLKAQRSYLNIAMENARGKLGNQFVGGGTVDEGSDFGQDVNDGTANGGSYFGQNINGATVDDGSYSAQELNGLGAILPLPTFYQNQQSTYNAYNSIEVIKGHLALEEQHNSFQAPITTYSAMEATFVGHSTDSYLEGFNAVPGHESNEQWTLDEDPAEAYLNYDDSNTSIKDVDHSFFNPSGAAGTSK